MNYTERYVTNFYLSIGVDSLKRLNMAYISDALHFMLCWDNQESKTYITDDMRLLIIDSRLDEQLQLQMFHHEIAHYILAHSYTNDLQLFKYFEGKADNLLLLLAMPWHLLNHMDLTSSHIIYELSETFNVSHELAFRRLEQIKDNLIQNGQYITTPA